MLGELTPSPREWGDPEDAHVHKDKQVTNPYTQIILSKQKTLPSPFCLIFVNFIHGYRMYADHICSIILFS